MEVFLIYKSEELPYLFEDLEPYIDTHTLALHYRIHQNNYLTKLNNILKNNNYDYRYNINELIYHINEFKNEDREDILYNLGGVLNHNLYWKSMNKKSISKKPFGPLAKVIEEKYSSFDNLYNEIKESALKIKGSGYTFLVLKNNGDIDIINLKDQQTPLLLGYIPLFTIDMWEHAYYLNYKAYKKEYLDNFKNIADFTNASIIYNSIIK